MKTPTKRRGSALMPAILMLMLISIAAATYISHATQTYRVGSREALEVKTTNLCEAGAQTVLRNLWRPFKIDQSFFEMDAQGAGAASNNPVQTISGTIPSVGNYSAGIISYTVDPNNPQYGRIVVVRCVGWLDQSNTGSLTNADPAKTVDVTAIFSLQRSQVFDYTYFVNNYGWMDGFGQNDLVVNGDMRSNGDFNFTNGQPTVNGSVFACQNSKLVPPAQGLVNEAPVKMTNSTYATANSGNTRARMAYNSSIMGAYGSTNWENWRDFAFDSTGQIDNNRLAGAALGDANGMRSWNMTSENGTATTSVLDTTPTQEVIMPDLSNISYYESTSTSYVDTKQTFADGTTNPGYGKGAYVQTWNSALNAGKGAYQTISTNGIVVGSAALIGSSAHPIIIHGPVTFTQDAIIKGNVSGQGTIYTGRNVHIVGSIVYQNPPNFQGSSQTTIDNANEKKDMLGLAAAGSVIMGDTSQFNQSYPLQYMEPPFTHPRYDDNGNLIPAYNAMAKDSTGHYLYQSVMGDSYIHSIASAVTQVDAVMYTNFVGGGDIGTGGSGVTINGSIISKDESMVVFSLPMKMNYDSRIREKQISQKPLIDLQLPRSPTMLRSSWQDRGFSYGGLN